MKTATKQFISTFFILLGFTPMLFIHLFVQKQQSIRHRMKERMEEERLHTVILVNKDIHWIKPEKEILVDGKMFDVKYTEQKDGKTIFYGLYDEEETALTKTLDEDWKKQSSGSNQLLVKLLQCLQGYYYNSAADETIAAQNKIPTGITSPPQLLTQIKTILTPPPQG